MKNLLDKAFDYRSFMLLVLALAVGLSFMFVQKIPSSLMPEFMSPRILVTAEYRGSNIKDVDALIAQNLERAILRTPGLRYVRAVVHESHVRIKATFEAEVNVLDAQRDVQLQVDSVLSDLPLGCARPVVQIDPNNYQEVCEINVHGPVSRQILLQRARDLQRALEEIKGVFSVSMWGYKQDRAVIELDPLRMMRMGVSPRDIMGYMYENNVQFADAELPNSSGSMVIHTKGRFETPEEVLNIPFARGENKVVRLIDCATLHMGVPEPTRAQFRHKGENSIVLSVQKRFGADALEILKRVGWAVDDVNEGEQCIPVDADIIWEVKHIIKDRLDSLYNTLMFAVILVIALVSLSLRGRSVLLVGLTIPTTFVITLAILYCMGYTLNMVVVFGLIAAVGVLVDGAIIVNEHADKLLTSGATPLEAYRTAAQRMIWPAFTSVLTIALSFFPLLFWPGSMGRTMYFLPMTEIVTLGISIFIALIFMPILGATMPEMRRFRKKPLWTFVGVMRFYQSWLEKSLCYPRSSMAGIMGSGVLIIFIFHAFNKGFEFFPSIEPARCVIHVFSSDQLSFANAQSRVDAVEAVVRAQKGVRYAVSFVGLDPDRQNSIGSVRFDFDEWSDREEGSPEIAEKIRAKLPLCEGQEYGIQLIRDVPNQGWPLEIVVKGRDCVSCQNFTRQLHKFLSHFEEIENLGNTLPPMRFHWELVLDREKMFVHNVSARDIRNYLGLLSSGLVVARYLPEDLDMLTDVVLIFPARFRSWEYLQNFLVKTPRGLSPLSLFVTMKPGVCHKVFLRYNGFYSNNVYGSFPKGVFLADIKPKIDQWIMQNKPANIEVEWEGADVEVKKTSQFLIIAFLASLIMIALILLVQFNNFFQVLIVLTSVVFSTLGALLGHAVMGLNFCVVMTGLGIVALSGIIVSNNVILLDTYNALMSEGKGHLTSLVQSSVSRIRPIFLTQITTILGLIPLMLSVDVQPLNFAVVVGAPSSAWWVHVSTTIVWGVAFATPFTLFATPLLVHLHARKKGLVAA